MRDMQKSRFTVARLTLQTLINTYPDSEFLPQAKYAMAESFYREGTSTALTEAENGFKDYITFFPGSALADDAQMKIAMAHVRRLEKPDRDRSQAFQAEAEFKSFIEAYPDSPLLNEAKQKLRDVQELLADGDAAVANFYFVKKDYPAALSRYKEILTKYPDYTHAPETLFNGAESLRRLGNDKEAVTYYSRIAMYYPLSVRIDDAKERLVAMKEPVPDPDPIALARAQQKGVVESAGVLGKVITVLKGRPSVSTSTSAASTAAGTEDAEPDSNAPVRGGTGKGKANGNGNGNGDSNGTFDVDPKVLNKTPPAKKFR
jgi:outer membrane protein assembly factor BamD